MINSCRRVKLVRSSASGRSHLATTKQRCITLLYFAIRLESRKSANKRIYLSIYLSPPSKQNTLGSGEWKSPWASTPLEHWGSQVERRRRENRGAVSGEGGGVWGRAVPLPRKFMNFSSQNGVIWCILGVLFLGFIWVPWIVVV